MIAVITGVVGFVSGAALAAWLIKRNKNQHWDGGYRMVRKDKFEPRAKQIQTYSPTNTYNTYKEPENKEPPTVPDWF